MRGNELLEKMELIAPEYIEAADEMPEQKKTRVTGFTNRPWMKWAVAAVLAVVIGVGTPVALNMMGVFRNENFVSPSGGSGNSGIITPIDGSEQGGGSEQTTEDASSSNIDEPSRSSSQPGGWSSETPDKSSSGTPEGDASEQPEGDFVKDNMPSVTYRINGEYKTFDYQSSTAVIDSGSSYVIDRYADAEGNTVSVDADSSDLIRYEQQVDNNHSNFADIISKRRAIEIAKSVVADSDIAIDGLESADISDYFSSGKRYITFAVEDGKVEVCLDNKGGLCHIIINKISM